jgi:hypothetical protein
MLPNVGIPAPTQVYELVSRTSKYRFAQGTGSAGITIRQERANAIKDINALTKDTIDEVFSQATRLVQIRSGSSSCDPCVMGIAVYGKIHRGSRPGEKGR